MAKHGLAQKAITPGSTESGDRQTLEGGLAQVLGGGGAGGGGGGQGAPLPAAPDGGQSGGPIQALLGGLHSTEDPVTGGLSQGPGRTPNSALEGLPVSTMQKLQNIALNAKSPQTRYMARIALKRIVKESRLA